MKKNKKRKIAKAASTRIVNPVEPQSPEAPETVAAPPEFTPQPEAVPVQEPDAQVLEMPKPEERRPRWYDGFRKTA